MDPLEEALGALARVAASSEGDVARNVRGRGRPGKEIEDPEQLNWRHRKKLNKNKRDALATETFEALESTTVSRARLYRYAVRCSPLMLCVFSPLWYCVSGPGLAAQRACWVASPQTNWRFRGRRDSRHGFRRRGDAEQAASKHDVSGGQHGHIRKERSACACSLRKRSPCRPGEVR